MVRLPPWRRRIAGRIYTRGKRFRYLNETRLKAQQKLEILSGSSFPGTKQMLAGQTKQRAAYLQSPHLP
jgi:hypothetical protein